MMRQQRQKVQRGLRGRIQRVADVHLGDNIQTPRCAADGYEFRIRRLQQEGAHGAEELHDGHDVDAVVVQHILWLRVLHFRQGGGHGGVGDDDVDLVDVVGFAKGRGLGFAGEDDGSSASVESLTSVVRIRLLGGARGQGGQGLAGAGCGVPDRGDDGVGGAGEVVGYQTAADAFTWVAGGESAWVDNQEPAWKLRVF